MKRKFKFMSTVASLSLAVALLVFGVFAAAANKSVDVTGTVGYTATNVQADVLVSQAYGVWSTDKYTYSYVAIGGATDENPHAEFTVGNGAVQTGKEVKLGDNGAIELDDNILSYSYQIKVTNKFGEGGSSIKAVFGWGGSEDEGAGTPPTQIGVAITPPEALTVDSIAPNGAATFIVTVVVDPTLAGTSFTGLDISGYVTLSLVA